MCPSDALGELGHATVVAKMATRTQRHQVRRGVVSSIVVHVMDREFAGAPVAHETLSSIAGENCRADTGPVRRIRSFGTAVRSFPVLCAHSRACIGAVSPAEEGVAWPALSRDHLVIDASVPGPPRVLGVVECAALAQCTPRSTDRPHRDAVLPQKVSDCCRVATESTPDLGSALLQIDVGVNDPRDFFRLHETWLRHEINSSPCESPRLPGDAAGPHGSRANHGPTARGRAPPTN